MNRQTNQGFHPSAESFLKDYNIDTINEVIDCILGKKNFTKYDFNLNVYWIANGIGYTKHKDLSSIIESKDRVKRINDTMQLIGKILNEKPCNKKESIFY